MLSGMRILVLEDEFLIAMDVEDICRENGASDVVVRLKLDGLESDGALAAPFDAAVLDLMLGEHSTLGFAAALRERSVPIVFTSGFAASDVVDRFPGAPFLAKPFAGSDLVEALRLAAGRSGRV